MDTVTLYECGQVFVGLALDWCVMTAKRHEKSITVTANSMITIDAAHQGSHSLLQNDWLCPPTPRPAKADFVCL